MTVKLTPTAELILEVLAARYRLGEQVWTFSTTLVPQLYKLKRAGLIDDKSGPVENTRLAWLTDEGKAAVLSPSYVPPNP